jgi:putative ABC transport system permease protein
MQRLWNRLKMLLRRTRQEQELQDEIAAHLTMDTQERIDTGSDPTAARREAHQDFGNVLQIAEATRITWGWTTAEQWLQDVRYGMRNLMKASSFSVVSVLTLAVGIGATTAIFSIVNAALLRPLPYPDPDRLVSVFSVNPAPNGGLWVVSPADFRDWRELSKGFESLAAFSNDRLSIWFSERPETIESSRVTWNFFDTLGVRPLLGKGFEAADELNGTDNLVLSHRLWQTRFGADLTVIGKQVRTDRGSLTIVGVMPPHFRFPGNAETWTTMGCCGEMTRRATRYWRTVARLRDGTSLQATQSELQSITSRLAERYPKDDKNWTAQILPFDRALVRDIDRALWILMGAAGFVIVIACANVAGLTLVRSASRRREIGVRLALGANRWRVMRQLFIEGLLLSFFGATIGFLLARWSVGAFFTLLPRTILTPLIRFRETVQLDTRVLLFAVVVSTSIAIILTLTPAWDLLKLALAESVRWGGNKTQTRGEHRIYRLLVIGQFACAIVLLAGAGLMTQSFVHMLNVEHGYEPDGLMIMSLPQPVGAVAAGGMAAANRQAFSDQVLERIKAVPSVESVALMSANRFGQLNFPFNREDRPFPNGDELVRYSAVSADYLRVLKSRLVAGRGFEERDASTASAVALINEKLAGAYFAGEDPIGRRIVLAYNNQRIPHEIIGVMSDVRQDAPGVPVWPEILVHWKQLPWLSGTLVIRAGGDPTRTQKLVQEAIWSVDKNLPPSTAETMEQVLGAQVATPRLYTILFGLFSAVAVMLAVLGIYGLQAYIVSRRTNEMAIRVAVGARYRSIAGLVIGEGVRLSLLGIVIGLVGSFILTRLMRSLLFEVSPSDPATLFSVALLLLCVALAGCYIPARRAARTDPIAVLRHE